MKESALTSSNRLGGAVISDRIVASLLEELRTGRYARADRLPAEVDLAAELGVSRTVIRDDAALYNNHFRRENEYKESGYA